MSASMQARVFHIEEKVRPKDTDFVSIDHFRYTAQGTTDAACLIESPHLTLFCLDDANGQAVFTDTPPELDLHKSAFYYQAQYQHARGLLTVPYSTLHEMADRAGDRFDKLILTYSVGRCGSTLLSRALNQVDCVSDLSEPDVYTQITTLRPRDGKRDAQFRQLLKSCTRLLFKPDGKRNTLAIKFRSFSIEIADLMSQVYPAARCLFLYRNAASWAQSQARAFGTFDADAQADANSTLKQNPKFLERTMPLVAEYVRKEIRKSLRPRDMAVLGLLALGQRLPLVRTWLPGPADYLAPQIRAIPRAKLLALQWLSVMNRYLDLRDAGLTMQAIRYETMIASPMPTLHAIFEYCNLPVDQVARAATVFGQDSQRDSPLSRNRLADRAGMTDEHLQQLSDLLSTFPRVPTPDYRVPGTLSI